MVCQVQRTTEHLRPILEWDILSAQMKSSTIERTCTFWPEAARGSRNPNASSLSLNQDKGVLPRKLIFHMSTLNNDIPRSDLLNLVEKSSTERTSWKMLLLCGCMWNTLTSPLLIPSVSKFDIYKVMRNSTQRVNKILYIFSPQTLPRESSLREALDIRILIMDSHSNTQV